MDDLSFLPQNGGQDLVENLNKTLDEFPVETKLRSFPNGTKIGNVEKDGIGFQFASNGSVGLDEDFGNMNGTGQLYYNDNKKGVLFNGTFVNGEIKDGAMYDPEGNVIIKKEKENEY